MIPLVVMSILGSTFQEVVSDLDVVVVDGDSSEYSKAVIKSINDSEYFNIIPFEGNIGEAKDRIGRDIFAVFYISENFESQLTNAEKGRISLYLDSSDFIIFNFIETKSEDILEDSVQGIIQIIVEDLETERLGKDVIITEIKELADSLYLKIGDINSDLDVVDINSLITGMDSLKTKVDALGENFSVTLISNQITSIKNDLNNYNVAISNTESSVDSGITISAEIKEKVENLKSDLKTLRNEFLSDPIETDKQYVFGNTNYFEYLLPAIISSSLFFVVFILTVVNRVRRKKTKNKRKGLFRLNILLIKSFFFILIGSLELIYILAIAKFVFNANVPLSPIPTLAVLILLAISSIGLGLVFSFIFRTEKQMILLGSLVILPLILISETFSSLKILPEVFGTVAYISPLYYSNLALREIMLKGSDLFDLLVPLGALLTYAILSITIGLLIFLFRKK
jgi:ABC-type multidrug transport system permease subunit